MIAYKQKRPYFCFNGEYFELFATADEAKARAMQSLADLRAIAIDEGWPDETGQICWGCVKGYTLPTVKTRSEYESEGDEAMVARLDSNDATETVRYDLVDVGGGE